MFADSEESDVAVWAFACGDGDVGVCIDGCHLSQLLGYSVVIVLYDAESIDPQVFESKFVGKGHAIQDCLW